MIIALLISALVATSAPTTRPTVQVVGISRQSDPAHWWAADGSPIAPPTGLQKISSGKAWLGIQMSDIANDKEVAEILNYPAGKGGVLVQGALVDSPAEGVLKKGDILSELDGKPIAGASAFARAIALRAPGTKVKIKAFRGEAFVDLEVKLGEMPEFGGIYLANNSREMEAYRLVLRITPWSEGDDVVIGAGEPESKAVRTLGPVIRGEKGVGEMEVTMLLPATQSTARIDIGVASGAWQTLVQCAEPGKGATRKLADGRSILVQKIVGLKGALPADAATQPKDPVVTSYTRSHLHNVDQSMILREQRDPATAFVYVMHSFPGKPVDDMDFRLMASAGDKPVVSRFAYSQTQNKQRMDRYGIQADPDAVDLILLQSRPWQWISLGDIALKPTATTKH